MGKEGISMSNSIMMRLIKCLSVIMLVIGCVQPTSVQAYSPVLTETVQNTNNTNKNSEHPVHDRLLGVLLYVSYMHIIR